MTLTCLKKSTFTILTINSGKLVLMEKPLLTEWVNYLKRMTKLESSKFQKIIPLQQMLNLQLKIKF